MYNAKSWSGVQEPLFLTLGLTSMTYFAGLLDKSVPRATRILGLYPVDLFHYWFTVGLVLVVNGLLVAGSNNPTNTL
jgi:hypothetical protein